MTNLFTELEILLASDSQYTGEEGNLLKNKIVEAALQLKPELIKLLLSNENLKKNFFTEVEGVLIFDKVKFQKFVSNKRFLPDSYTSFKNKIGLVGDEGDFLAESKEVVLSWPYKDCVLEGGQTKEDTKRNEVFWNEILAPDEINRLTEPKALTNFVKYDSEGEHKLDSISKDDNLIIKGNNLLALHSLKEKYAGQVKLIYIDPPYNTGGDGFGYNDTFNHSAWLTFMKNRLEIARDILADDGSIWINIDDNELCYLKLICDNIFKRENFVCNIAWHKNYASANDSKTFSNVLDYILVYRKTDLFKRNLLPRTDKQNTLYKYDSNDGKGLWRSDNLTVKTYSASYDYPIENPYTKITYNPPKGRCWMTNKETIQKWIEEGRVFFGQKNDGAPQLKRYLNEVQDGVIPITYWSYDECGHNDESRKEIKALFETNLFSTPKPERLIRRIVQIGSEEGDLVLDFFAGSGTTAAVAHKMKRRIITIEQMDYINTVTIERFKKVIGKKVKEGMFEKLEFDEGGITKDVNWRGGGSFVYCELAKSNQNFIDQIQTAATKDELQIIWQSMQETGFLSWKVNPKEINNKTSDFIELDIAEMKRFLIEVLDKNLLYVPYSEIDNEEFGISDEDKRLNKIFYAKKV